MDDSMFDVDASDGSEFNDAPKVKAKPKAKTALKQTTIQAVKMPKAPKAVAAGKAARAPAKKAGPKKRGKGSDDENDDPSDDSMMLDDEDSELGNTPPQAKKTKKVAAVPAAKKAPKKPLTEVHNESFTGVVETYKPAQAGAKSGDASERYEKLDHLEHILRRPDTYIGSVEQIEKRMWVYNTEKDSMELRDITYVPGLYKIFDEIIVNAADNKQNDKNMDEIRVTFDREKGEISVWNNGRGIPIEIHKKEQIYIPEMIFGHLLTGSNYNDAEQKTTGGRNGYGAKLCNVYSTKFILETADNKSKKRYRQVWTNNMRKMHPASIENQKGEDYTHVTFYPDFAKFKMDGFDDDFEALFKRRVYDLAGTCKGVKVYLNGDRLRVKNFKEYMTMFTNAIKSERGEEAANDTSDIVTDTDKDRWEIGFAVSDGTFQQVSFVNSIATTSGGTHVNYIADQITDKLMVIVKKRNKAGASLKPAQIRNHIFVFVNSQIVNPAFNSQSKEQLSTKGSQFGSKFVVTDDFMKKVLKTDILSNILAFAEKKADQILKKSDGNKRSRMDNPKLTDANKAGTKDGHMCTLILTEGDSAKGLAMTGRSIVGPDLFGVFPLRGKLLNVRDASIDQISKNAEIQNIKNILGLKHKTEYTDCKSMRYGHIMIMTDQDHDGSHIKGLLINFLQVQYPSLLKIPGFLLEFITPIVKVYKGDPKRPSKAQTFFTMPEYEVWKEEHKHERGWEHKYYKGLGTTNEEDTQRYFNDLDKHLKTFHKMRESEPELIELAFSKKKADERKEWLRQCVAGTYLDHSMREITYTDFVNKELILFSMADNMRSIPSVIDGFKPGQRKCLYACFKKNLKKDMKVVELAGYVLGLTAYQHGEASLQQTIVGLAQTFVGSNNVNCLEPSGNFGSRLQGGTDAASARYIYTRLSPFARRVFHSLDEPILKYNTDDDKQIEPEIYVPVVPMVLINGADGIGTGWSSSIPNYNPVDIVDNLKRMLKGEEPVPMIPWFRDFKGKVEKIGEDRYRFSGTAEAHGNDVEITELPIRMWTQDFKDKLIEIIKSEKIPSWIKDYDDYNTKKDVNFLIHLEEKHMKAALDEGLLERFKLTKTIATSNLVAFDAEGRITKYANAEEILKAFYDVRIKFYQKRKAHMLAEWNKDLDKITNQARFIKEIIDGKLVVAKKSKKVLVPELQERGYRPFPKVRDHSKEAEVEHMAHGDEDTEEMEGDSDANAFDYLLGMPIWSMTKERIEKLLKQQGDKQDQIDELMKLSIADLWTKDLDEFILEWHTQLAEEREHQKKLTRLGRRVSSTLRTQMGGRPTGAKKRKNDSDDDEDFGVKRPKKTAPTTSKAAEPKPRGGILAALLSSNEKPKAKPVLIKPTQSASLFAKTASSKPKTTAMKEEEEDDDDVWLNQATVDGAADPRPARNVAKKPVKYDLSSDSEENGDSMLLDVGSMVKGIGGSSTAQASSRPLFSEKASSSRPGSSAGLSIGGRKSFATGREKFGAGIVNNDDETDFQMLAAATPATAARSALVAGKSDDADYSFDVEKTNPNSMRSGLNNAKKTGSAKTKANATIFDDDDASLLSLDNGKTTSNVKTASIKPAKATSKPKTTAKPTKGLTEAGKKGSSSTSQVSKGSSKPAKKAPAASSKVADELADELLEDSDQSPVAAISKRSTRPARAAAQSKKVWVLDDDDGEDGFDESKAYDDFDDSD